MPGGKFKLLESLRRNARPVRHIADILCGIDGVFQKKPQPTGTGSDKRGSFQKRHLPRQCLRPLCEFAKPFRGVRSTLFDFLESLVAFFSHVNKGSFDFTVFLNFQTDAECLCAFNHLLRVFHS
ncbi:MAG: hypothetical protein H6869_00090 [Rhodospirillales bacterium]|nr:hypothetical protein [Rhodospirillales bacterium]